MNRARRAAGALLVLSAAAMTTPTAWAEQAPPPPPRGLAVVALEGATDAAWPLARAVYARDALRPAGIDEPRARALVGEALPADAPPPARDLAETRAAIKGEDVASRRLLGTVAADLNVRGIVLVQDASTARLYLPGTGGFDAATYRMDAAQGWIPTVESLERTYGVTVPAASRRAPRAAVAPAEQAPSKTGKAGEGSRPFYGSGFFWGAVGAAALCGVILFAATRDTGRDTIHVDVQVPR